MMGSKMYEILSRSRGVANEQICTRISPQTRYRVRDQFFSHDMKVVTIRAQIYHLRYLDYTKVNTELTFDRIS